MSIARCITLKKGAECPLNNTRTIQQRYTTATQVVVMQINAIFEGYLTEYPVPPKRAQVDFVLHG